jgi:hypothetical protein
MAAAKPIRALWQALRRSIAGNPAGKARGTRNRVTLVVPIRRGRAVRLKLPDIVDAASVMIAQAVRSVTPAHTPPLARPRHRGASRASQIRSRPPSGEVHISIALSPPPNDPIICDSDPLRPARMARRRAGPGVPRTDAAKRHSVTPASRRNQGAPPDRCRRYSWRRTANNRIGVVPDHGTLVPRWVRDRVSVRNAQNREPRRPRLWPVIILAGSGHRLPVGDGKLVAGGDWDREEAFPIPIRGRDARAHPAGRRREDFQIHIRDRNSRNRTRNCRFALTSGPLSNPVAPDAGSTR